MRVMEICFVGIGSIAKRHIKNLRIIAQEKGIELHIDAIRRSKVLDDDTLSLNLRNIYCSYDEIKCNYDVVFVTNPTQMHLETIRNMKSWCKNFFVEKPIVTYEQVQTLEDLDLQNDVKCYVACPLRYNAVIQYIKHHIDLNDVISIRSISSSYLPDWRPGTDYRNTYSAQEDLGGGVSIDLIHEWDYLTYLFGNPKSVQSIITRKSNLEINSDDLAIYLAEYEDKAIELHLDYFGRKTIREVMLITKDETIIGDIANSKISFLKSGEEMDFHEERDAYQIRELEHFLDIIDDKKINDNTIKHAVDVLKISQGEI